MAPLQHEPVLITEVLDLLDCRPGRIYVDGTVGSGGHSRAILEKSSPTGRLIGLDRDEEALGRARENLSPFQGRVNLVKANFKDLKGVLEPLSIEAVDAILLDLGLSTEQLESRERGFSFRWDAPLDMRMDQETKVSVRELLRDLSAEEIASILREYGEERRARAIARNIVRRRESAPVRTTAELVEVIRRSVPPRHQRIHPATRTFQALRVAVNDELHNLRAFLDECPALLNPGGRLSVISYHSLEDRIVKNQFRLWAPKKEEAGAKFRLLTRKPVVPSDEEIARNPRARSAKMRVVEKIGNP